MGLIIAWKQADLNSVAFHNPAGFPPLKKTLELIDPPPPQSEEDMELILRQLAQMAGMKETIEPIS